MNKISKIALLAAIPLLGLTSCLDDDKYVYFNPEECWGTVSGTQDNFQIVTDNGNTLRVTKNMDPSFAVENDMRVVAAFVTLEQTGDNSYDVQVNGLKKLLTKNPVYLSELTQPQIDSLGTDPIKVANAWFGAKRYLDIEFLIRMHNPQQPHFINLVVDEEKSTADEVFVTLRHNAFKDERSYEGWGRVSFDIAKLVPDGKDQVKVTLQWTGWDGVSDSASGIFKLKENNSAPLIAPVKQNSDIQTKSVTIR